MTSIFFFFQNTLHLKFRSSYMEEVKSSYSKTPLLQRPYNQKVQRPSPVDHLLQWCSVQNFTAVKDFGKSLLSCNRIWLLVWISITLLLVHVINALWNWKYTDFLHPYSFLWAFMQKIVFSECLNMLLSFYLPGVAFRCGWRLVYTKSPRRP